MSNPYFQFKQFTVYHDRCAMKVGTDGVLLGAWTDVSDAQKTLDIGIGSGLISLMLAQRNNQLKIDGIDIDKDAIEQAKENVAKSIFSSQITCLKVTFQEFEPENKKYDLIISNPPFFTRSLKSPNDQRSAARHNDELPIEYLLRKASQILSENGKIAIIYPYDYKKNLLKIATQAGLSVSRITNVYPTPTSQPKRVLMEFKKEDTRLIENDLTIEIDRHIYSDDFTKLVKDFYLKL